MRNYENSCNYHGPLGATMRRSLVVFLACLVLSLPLLMSCAKATKDQQSLTAEQIDIYVLFFNKLLNEHNVNAVLVDHTEQLKLSEYDLKDACLSGIEIPNAEQRTFYAGSLGPEFIALIKPRLTHPSRLRPISPDDLSHLRETPFPKSEDGFTSGWLRLSEVVF